MDTAGLCGSDTAFDVTSGSACFSGTKQCNISLGGYHVYTRPTQITVLRVFVGDALRHGRP